MTRFSLTTLFFFALIAGFSQSIDWTQTKSWKIYRLNNQAAFGYPADTLHHFKNVPLNDDSVISYFIKATPLPKDKVPVWMGLYIATYETGDKLRKIVFSNYGGFFYDADSKRYYELPKKLRRNWDQYLLSCLDKVFGD